MVMEGDLLLELAASLLRQGKRVAVLARAVQRPLLQGMTWIAAPDSVDRYAHDLYANLRQLDKAGADAILVEALPQDAQWAALRDRLTRASASGLPPEAT